MKRDLGYALLAALSLLALTALWALANAPTLANPKEADRARGNTGSLPVLPRRPDNSDALDQAVALLETRDLFSATAPADMASLRRLSKARIAPPVELTPVEDAPRQVRRGFVEPQVTYRPAPPITPRQQSIAPPLPQSPPPPAPQVEKRPIAPPAPAYAPPTPQPQPTQQAQAIRDQRFPLTLRGVFPNPQTGGRAHVALPNGRIVSTGTGGVIEGFQVLQINAASIIVQGRGSPPLRLEMPGY